MCTLVLNNVNALETLKLKKGKYSHPSGRKNALNNLTGSEWAQSSKSVVAYEDVRSEKQRIHGASFPQTLAEHQIMTYTKRGQTVLDPFVGVGTTLDACVALHRHGIGIELNSSFVQLANEDLAKSEWGLKQKLICDDARNLLKHVPENSVDFVLTSPPYANMLKKVQRQFLYKWKPFGFRPVKNARPYSNDQRDIGNLSYDECLTVLGQIFRDTLAISRKNSYATWVVKDFRNLKNGQPYVNFHGDIINIGSEAGWKMWDLRVFDQTRFRPLVVLGIPSRNFYVNIGHSFMLTFKKE